MKSYVPNTENERLEMLQSIGLSSMDDLYVDVPEDLKLHRPLNLPEGMSEEEVRRVFKKLAALNNDSMPIFRGAGVYHHYIPAAVPQLAMRNELYTAYTPYQCEMSQGMLQAIFEYQTLMCELTGLDASNASVYDGATAAGESLLALRDSKRKKKILFSAGLHPDVKAVMGTYARFAGLELVEVPLNADGVTDVDKIAELSAGAAGMICPQINFYGCIEDMQAVSDAVHAFGGLFVAYVNPLALGALIRPVDYDADFAIGEGQPLGQPMAFGGPYFGFMTAKQKYIRNLPGRIVGQTADSDGNRAFVLTLQAREQHIRREKAASNICSNECLCVIMASIYLAQMGPQGMKEVAYQNLQKAHYLAEGMKNIKGIKLRYPNTPFFNEFAIDTDKCACEINDALKAKGIVGGLKLSHFDKDDKGMLWCATECNTREEIDAVLSALEEVLA